MKFSAKPSSMLKLAFVLFAGVLAMGAAEAQQTNIGVLNSQRIRAEAPQMKAAQARMKQEFDKRLADLHDMRDRIAALQQKYETEKAMMTEAQIAKASRDLGEQVKDYERRKRELEEDINQRSNEEEETALLKVRKVVQQVAEENKLDLVLLQEGSVAYASPRIDITDKVLKALSK